ncbi:MAG TPA: hypothetical protein VKA49_06595, partial [Flavitalea sp.]|nr:hypothetical protein [Flavitalea sp.]
MIRRPKIAIFIDWFEPGFKAGGPIRSIANFIHHLGDTYEIYIITSDRDIDDLKSYEGVSTDNWIDRHEYKVFYASPGGLNFSSIKRLLQQISPDWIYVNGMFSWTYSILPVLVRTFFYKKASILLAPRGMLKESALKFKPAKKKIFLAIFNAIYVRSNVIFQATDAGEKLDIACIFGKNAKTVRLPNFPGIQRNFIPV